MPLPQNITDALDAMPEEMREAFLEAVTAEAKRQRTVRRKTLRHVFRGAALRLLTDETPELVVSGPARTGKSLAALFKIHTLLSTYPSARALLVRKTRASLTQTGLETYENMVLGPGNPISDGPQRANRASYLYPNGSELVIGGMDKSTRIMSSEYDFIFVQEATELTEDEWEMLSTRLSGDRLPYQQLLADCNPSYPQHWLKKREAEGKLLMLQSWHRDNPAFYDDNGEMTARGRVYLARLDQLTGVRRDRLRDGKWVSAEGAIYPLFSDDRNVHDWFKPPSEWRKFLAVDFGYTNPMVMQWWAVDPDDCMWMYREFYQTQVLVEDAAQIIKKFDDFWDLEAIVCDWDAEGRATLEKHLNDYVTTAAIKDISTGIEQMQIRIQGFEHNRNAQMVFMRDSLIQVDPLLVEYGKPLRTIDEIPAYVWMPNNKEKPLGVDDHGCDTARYAAMYLSTNGSADSWVLKPR